MCKKEFPVSTDSNSVKFQISRNESILSSSVHFTQAELFIFSLFSVFVTLDEFEHCFALNTPAIPDTERRNFVFVQ